MTGSIHNIIEKRRRETKRRCPHFLVKGGGVAGLNVAWALQLRGARVTITDPNPDFTKSSSWLAGGMLAPWCERENAANDILELGLDSADRWDEIAPGRVTRRGTIVISNSRDNSEISSFAGRTCGWLNVNSDDIAELEPSLAGRFDKGLYFKNEAHLNPRDVMLGLKDNLLTGGASFIATTPLDVDFDGVVECIGAGGIGSISGLRGVRGEAVLIRSREVTLTRPVRLLHPRFPIYIVPRGDAVFMIGATMIETDYSGPVTVRSLMELLNAAYSVHPAFAEAELIETAAGVRPAFRDNMPKVLRCGDSVVLNGLYRHGFLLAPMLAERAADLVFESY